MSHFMVCGGGFGAGAIRGWEYWDGIYKQKEGSRTA